MNHKNLTHQSKRLLENGIGYRNNGLGSGMYSILDIIEFETRKLENEDITDTCKVLYGTSNYQEVLIEHFGNFLEKEETIWGLWLANKENVLYRYAEDGETEISSYKIPKNAIIISDLGEEGTLFAFKERPDFLYVDTEVIKDTISYSERLFKSKK